MDSELKYKITKKSDEEVIYLSGSVGERSLKVLNEIAVQVVGDRCRFNLKGIVNINSIGFGSWVHFFVRFSEEKVVIFEDCSYECLRQHVLSSALLSFGTVTSCFLPFWCDDCDVEVSVQLRTGTDRETFLDEVDKLSCSRCGGNLVVDEEPVLDFAIDMFTDSVDE